MSGPSRQRNTPEKYRPVYHFSPAANWMNDPNGMVFVNGLYHLFYQHNPGDDVWGNMHWGHASSTDLRNWTHYEPAILPGGAPDEFVFSGCCVHDRFNESGLGIEGIGPILAFYTFSDEQGGRQRQCISYSRDDGVSWHRYAGNPVLSNDGRADFRDPKVFWYADGECWSMIVAAGQELLFYRSTDLLRWEHCGSFAVPWKSGIGCCECPDLFELEVGSEKRWVLLVSFNPGEGEGGYATQYVVGRFDGEKFQPDHTDRRCLDWGPDCFAAVTWEAARGVEIPRCCIGWMNNWRYAEKVPTAPWRGQMTVPRTLSLKAVGDQHYLLSEPAALPAGRSHTKFDTSLSESFSDVASISDACEITLTIHTEDPDTVVLLRLGNTHGEALTIGWDRAAECLHVDRGGLQGSPGLENFVTCNEAQLPRDGNGALTLRVLLDRCSIEVFAANGLVCITALHFPKLPLTAMAARVERGLGSIAGQVSHFATIRLPLGD